VWLADPLDAYIAHVNGSAFVDVPGKGMLRLGYAGKNGRAYTSLGKELLDDARLARNELDLAGIRRWAAEHPAEVDEYLGRNDSYVFFQPIEGNPRGSLNVEVQARRSLATDKTLFPRGALVYVNAELPDGFGGGTPFRQFLFDQDTGGAIRTAGRADIYMGIGLEAEEIAGGVTSEGQLFYFFLKE
jgi:membrane-bound lytic murein transglycosylase A